jgi:hypothetical protein
MGSIWKGLLAAAGVLILLAARPAAAAEACAPAGKVRYLCGLKNAEDLAPLPGSPFMIVSGMSGSGAKAGELYLVDTRARRFSVLEPDLSGPPRKPYADCPGAPPAAVLAPHGLALRPGRAGRHLLYAVNHGGRQSVELFQVDARSGAPKVRWIGCVVMPKDVNPNSVAPTPEGGFVVTKFDANDAEGFPAMAAGKATGSVLDWEPGKGFRQIPGSVLSGDNGVVVSPDGRWVFVNAWPEKRVVRLARRGAGAPASAAVDFMPDNLHWAGDGRILVAGQVADMKTLLDCKAERCPHDWAVVRLDPKTMRTAPVLRERGTQAFSDATGAVQVGTEVWVGTYRGDRLAHAAVK